MPIKKLEIREGLRGNKIGASSGYEARLTLFIRVLLRDEMRRWKSVLSRRRGEGCAPMTKTELDVVIQNRARGGVYRLFFTDI